MQEILWSNSEGNTDSVNNNCNFPMFLFIVVVVVVVVVATSLSTVKKQQKTRPHKDILLAVLWTERTVSFDPSNLYIMCLVDWAPKSLSMVRSLDLLL